MPLASGPLHQPEVILPVAREDRLGLVVLKPQQGRSLALDPGANLGMDRGLRGTGESGPDRA